jgi:hypothetical protein
MHDVLKPAERDEFASVLWGKVDNEPEALPADTQLLASELAKLPAPAGIDPAARAKTRIFGRNLKDVMDCSGLLDSRVLSEKQNHLVSLYNTAPLELSMPAKRAVELFDQIVSWEPAAVSNGDLLGAGFRKSFNESVSQLAGDVLTFAIVPAMDRNDKNAARLQALLDFVKRTKSWRAVGALPDFVETVPELRDDITRTIHRGLSASEHMKVSGAATALMRWSRLVKTSALADMPKMLIEQLLSMIETRQEEVLHMLLNTSVDLVKDGSHDK